MLGGPGPGCKAAQKHSSPAKPREGSPSRKAWFARRNGKTSTPRLWRYAWLEGFEVPIKERSLFTSLEKVRQSVKTKRPCFDRQRQPPLTLFCHASHHQFVIVMTDQQIGM